MQRRCFFGSLTRLEFRFEFCCARHSEFSISPQLSCCYFCWANAAGVSWSPLLTGSIRSQLFFRHITATPIPRSRFLSRFAFGCSRKVIPSAPRLRSESACGSNFQSSLRFQPFYFSFLTGEDDFSFWRFPDSLESQPTFRCWFSIRQSFGKMFSDIARKFCTRPPAFRLGGRVFFCFPSSRRHKVGRFLFARRSCSFSKRAG